MAPGRGGQHRRRRGPRAWPHSVPRPHLYCEQPADDPFTQNGKTRSGSTPLPYSSLAKSPWNVHREKDAEAEPRLTFIECLLHAHIAISTVHAISYVILTTALDRELRLGEDKDYVPGHSAQDVSELGIKPRLSRVASFQPGYMKTLKLVSMHLLSL